MPRKPAARARAAVKTKSSHAVAAPAPPARPSALLNTRNIYYCDYLDQLKKLPVACIDLIYIDPPFNSNRNYEVFWGETKEKRAFEDRRASTAAYIDYMRPRSVELACVRKKTGSFYYHGENLRHSRLSTVRNVGLNYPNISLILTACVPLEQPLRIGCAA